MKLCRDCLHRNEKNECERTIQIDYVNGKHTKTSCQVERTYDTKDGCGPNAKYFERIALDEAYENASYESDAESASKSIDRENARYINRRIG